MGSNKNSTSKMDVAEKMHTPLAQRLYALITDANALKDHLGVSIQAVNQYRLGLARPSLENLCKIADFYNVSTDYILGRTEEPSADPDIQKACSATGLSGNAIVRLHKVAERGLEDSEWFVPNPFEALLSTDGPVFEHFPDGSEVSASEAFLIELSYYMGLRVGEQEPSPYCPAEKYEISELSEMLGDCGCVIMTKFDAAEIHLQNACDALKMLFRAWRPEKEE